MGRRSLPDASSPDVCVDGNRIQLAWHHDHAGPIYHGDAFWRLYVNTDDCRGLYERAIPARASTSRVRAALLRNQLRSGPMRSTSGASFSVSKP